MRPFIRLAGPADHDALVEQYLGLNLHEDRSRTTASPIAPAPRKASRSRKRGSRKRTVQNLVAEIESNVVGHLFLTFEQGSPFVRQELRAYACIAELFVRAEGRRLGVARALLQKAERIARERGVSASS